ncbi:MAG: phosphatase PAP2 family protein [Planctomycetota bacterium]
MIPNAPPALLNPRRGSVERWQTRSRVRLILIVGLAATLALHLFDHAAFDYFLEPEFRAFGVNLPDWYHVFRQFGNMMTWVFIALAFWGADARRTGRVLARPAWSRAAYLTLASAGAGLVAEIGKVLVARERPISGASIEYQGYVHHWPLIDPLLGQTNLGFPSSHTAVAFGAAFAIARLLPGTFPAMLLLAMGCGWSRMLMGAHFLTDVAGGIVLAWAWVVWLPTPGSVPARARP